MKSGTVRNKMEKLKTFGFLDIKPDRCYSVVTVHDKIGYEYEQKQVGQVIGQEQDRLRTGLGQVEDTEKKVKKEKNVKKFSPPTVEEMQEYCNEKGYMSVNPITFVSHYQSNGWKVGKNPMKDWKSAVTGWNTRNGGEIAEPTNGDPSPDVLVKLEKIYKAMFLAGEKLDRDCQRVQDKHFAHLIPEWQKEKDALDNPLLAEDCPF